MDLTGSDPFFYGSSPNAPATFLDAGVDRSEHFEPASFCAIERLPALCEV
jgi:hypothetical protein